MKSPAGTTGFYNKVTKKFGQYHTDAKDVKATTPENDPEVIFQKKLFDLSGKDKKVLDVGCADGRFCLSIASKFSEIVAIDMSEGMLQSARNLQQEKGVDNVTFDNQDAFHTSYKPGTFDMVYSRRGPTPFAEAYRLLKPGCHFVEIDIGEKDCKQIKEVFCRGQNFGKWDRSRLDIIRTKAQEVGFEVLFGKDFFYPEYYASYDDLDLFLQGVPIFEDFDSVKDKDLLEKYVEKFSSKKGIALERHRVVSVLQKNRKLSG